MDPQTRERIKSAIEGNDVVLFMKGTKDAPRCGFSATVVQILDTLGASYVGVDVLADQAIREGIKEYSDWPTIPQLYVRNEFIGGCDIVKELYGSGELEEKLGVKPAEVPAPKLEVTAAAAKALSAALESPGEGVRLEIGPRFEYQLSIGTAEPRDVVVDVSGLKIILDRGSAQRASGTTIDYVEGPQGAAFKIQNPNEPPKVKQMSPGELAAKLRSGEPFELLDVRAQKEREVAKIEGSKLLDRAEQERVSRLPKDTVLVFHCHHGGRSQQAAEFFLSQGFRNVHNVSGGIDAWSVEVDPKVPRY